MSEMLDRNRPSTRLFSRSHNFQNPLVRSASLVLVVVAAGWHQIPQGLAINTIGRGWWPALGEGRVPAPAVSSSSQLAPLDRQSLMAAHAGEISELRGDTGSLMSDHDLLAHFRAANLNGQQPADRVRATDAWRLDSDISKKMSNKKWVQAERELRRVLKCDYLGSDRHGRPILVQRVGAWDLEAVEAAADDSERFVMLNAMVCENLLRLPRPGSARDPRGVVVIMDMEGLSLSHLSSNMLCAFAKVARVVRSYYPDILADLFIINTPWVFTALKTAIRPLFNADSLSKMHISSALPDEITDLGVKRLPPALGGVRKNVFPYLMDAAPSDVHL